MSDDEDVKICVKFTNTGLPATSQCSRRSLVPQSTQYAFVLLGDNIQYINTVLDLKVFPESSRVLPQYLELLAIQAQDIRIIKQLFSSACSKYNTTVFCEEIISSVIYQTSPFQANVSS